MMERWFIALLFALLSISSNSCASDTEEVPDVSVRKGVASQYKNKLEPGSRVDYVVNWKYYEQKGTILAVRQLSGRYSACVLYQLEDDELKIIQGQPFCKWNGKPVVVTQGRTVSVDFPLKIKQSADFPYIDSRSRLSFDPIRKSLCSYEIFYGSNAATIGKCENN